MPWWWMLAAGCREDPSSDDPDPGASARFWADSDADSYGDPEISVEATSAPTGYVANDDDCDDDDPAVHPGAGETCSVGDEDCDGLTQEDDPDLTGTSTFYADPDGDGRGDPDDTIEACEAPPGYVDDVEECANPAPPLDWVDGIDQDGAGGVDLMVRGKGDGWDLVDLGAYDYQPTTVGAISTSLDVEGDGEVDWFVVATTRPALYSFAPGPVDGLFRIDDVRCTPPGEVYGVVPHLTLPGMRRVDLWEDTTGDGVPELLVSRQLFSDFGAPLNLDLYLVDPTTTGSSAAIEDLALVHVAVPRGAAGPVADFDGDGHPEVVYSDLDRRSLVFLGTLPAAGDPIVPDAEIATGVEVPYVEFAVGNLNGDAAADLAVLAHQRVIFGGADLGALPLDGHLQVENYFLFVADFDGDGLDDVATTGLPGPYAVPFELAIHYGDPAGIAATPDLGVRMPMSASRGFLADVDGGGRADLLLIETTGSSARLFLGEDELDAQVLVLDAAIGSTYGVADIVHWGPLVDVDLDGHADVLARDIRTIGPEQGSSLDLLWGEPY